PPPPPCESLAKSLHIKPFIIKIKIIAIIKKNKQKVKINLKNRFFFFFVKYGEMGVKSGG
ncbi:hypothetical protein, partial [Campylobacter upsaliensis]|uniref:hypothetical protein n=1 Tax=Campylobacter upsaliensis TaxID=28080 RepID=UPI0022EA1DB1